MRVEYHPVVEAELKAIQRYYEDRSPSLGVRFTDEFERQVLEWAARPRDGWWPRRTFAGVS